MPSIKELVANGQRSFAIRIGNAELNVTDRVYIDCETERAMQARRDEAAKRLREIEIESKDLSDDRLALKLQLEGLKRELEVQVREDVCAAVVARISGWDLLDDGGNVVPLEADVLIKADLPTELLAEILNRVRAYVAPVGN